MINFKKKTFESKETKQISLEKKSVSINHKKIVFENILKSSKLSSDINQSISYFIGAMSISKEKLSNYSNMKKANNQWPIKQTFKKSNQKTPNKVNKCLTLNNIIKSMNQEQYKSIYITNKCLKKTKNYKIQSFVSNEDQDEPLLVFDAKEKKFSNRSSNSSPKQVVPLKTHKFNRTSLIKMTNLRSQVSKIRKSGITTHLCLPLKVLIYMNINQRAPISIEEYQGHQTKN